MYIVSRIIRTAKSGGTCRCDRVEYVSIGGNRGENLPTGRYVNQGSKLVANMYLTMTDQMGLSDLPRSGDSEGRLANV